MRHLAGLANGRVWHGAAKVRIVCDARPDPGAAALARRQTGFALPHRLAGATLGENNNHHHASIMEAFRWDPCFLTHLSSVDEQHHYLVDLINQYGEHLMQPEGVSAQEIERLLQELERYTVYHFDDEEGLMARSGMDARFIANHKQEHAQFVHDVVSMHKSANIAEPEEARALLSFLTNWLAYHILGSDHLMAWLMNAAQAGTPADEAFEAYQKSRDPATSLLLQAMSRLVAQLSQRGRALHELNQTLEARVAERTQALSEMNQRLQTMAMTDVLTGLPNRRAAMQVLEREWQLAAGEQGALSCMMIDADGFKQINDHFGHDAGDVVLTTLARCLRDSVRSDDVVCRLGGDEFLIVCPATGLDGALLLAEKVRAAVAALRVPAGQGQWVGSISVGVAQCDIARMCIEALLKTADEGVYLAKDRGRNCVASVQKPTHGVA